MRLTKGDFANGWEDYEWRWKRKNTRERVFAEPAWDGGDVRGRRVLLYAEQGLGDTLQFVRYASIVQALGATTIVECQRRLVSLLSRTPGIDELVPAGESLPRFDVHVALLSVPYVRKTTVETIPSSGPYLHADPALEARWRSVLGALDGFKVGVAWQGNPRYPGDRFRSIPLAAFEPLARVPRVRLVSLQRGAGEEQRASLRGRFDVIDLAGDLREESGAFTDTAAAMRNLDLVVTSDTSIAHVAGGLGVPVWVVLPAAADWRWLTTREDSPWYPTMRLFRQRARGDWSEPFLRVATALEERARSSVREPLR